MTRTAIIIAGDRAYRRQDGWGAAFAAGLRRHGWTAVLSRHPAPADMLVLWGVRRQGAIALQRRHGEVCILERGYVGDRFAWTSVSFGGGLNGRATFRGPLDDSSRWQTHFAPLMRPWRRRDGYALIMGQVLTDMSLRGLKPLTMWNDAARALKAGGFDVRFRPHPLSNGAGLPGIGTLPASLSLAEALAGAALVVTINSNAGVDAAVAGVPTVTLDGGAMAWPVAGHRPETPPTPDRAAWATALAWKQWRMEEIASGHAWALVGGGTG
ncbi:hypothetical protein [Labrys monachus]|uniref:Glycosyltransferase n=1 Tax=Labrys monachus TaxID=217067 RepID=A0ABU0FET2_9HYPH|nr:hypothetical protein [Labrys monachus]MDQ0393124.1 hypothetical protein [Labrys monachus]